MKGRRLPYAVEMQILRRRMYVSVAEVCEEFGVSSNSVYQIMERNSDLVAKAEEQIRQETLDGIVADSRLTRPTTDDEHASESGRARF